MTAFHQTKATYRPGARTLPGEYYTAPAILTEEIEKVFLPRWHCVGRASAISKPGQYFLADVAGESLIVVSDPRGKPHALFNVCRHRGTRLCSEPTGQFSETIQCPYHAWTYATDGRLIGAPHMSEVEGFSKADYPLHSASIATWEGFLFVNVSERPAPFADVWATVIERLGRFALGCLEVGHTVTYDVWANWKLVFQNYSECLHCPSIHPELNAVLPYQSGANDLTEGPFLGGYMDLKEPHESATMSGKACGLPVNPNLPDDDRRRAFYYALLPNTLLSIHPDYVNYYLVAPVTPERTTVHSQWLFHPASRGTSQFNPTDAIEFWDVTNRQDWDIIARSQLGVASRRYAPGPYSPRESIPAAWDREYLRIMGRA